MPLSDRPSPRELQVLELLAKGLSNRKIADDLCITENRSHFKILSTHQSMTATKQKAL